MKIYKSPWFWAPFLVILFISINLEKNILRGLLFGILVGFFLGFFLWFIFGFIDKIKIPSLLPQEGYKIRIYEGTLVKENIKYSLLPIIRIFDNSLKLEVINNTGLLKTNVKEKEVEYNDIKNIDVDYGLKNIRTKEIARFKAGYRANLLFKLEKGDSIILNVHKKSNIQELLKFFKNKDIQLSDSALERIETQDIQ